MSGTTMEAAESQTLRRLQISSATSYLNEQGYRLIRFWNEQINREIEDMLEAIYAALTDS
jgi:very-short-patch-repair endonuclease